ncbi:S-antigen protein-like [Hetaerina americana]|uniref:S-antigen protein-like n=1 Tax=Hetaerina americana TaxID=62018 RepID=UPI003A7F43A3
MNHGRLQLAEGELREPKKKKVKPGTLLRDPYPIIFWNKLGIPPCKELWPSYMGVFDGDSVMVDDPGDMHEISTMVSCLIRESYQITILIRELVLQKGIGKIFIMNAYTQQIIAHPSQGYFGKRFLCRRGYEQSVGDVPVVRERHWKRRVEWAAECGYILVPPDKESGAGSPQKNAASDSPEGRVAEGEGAPDVESEVLPGDGSGNKESERRVTMNGRHQGKPDVEGTVCEVKECGAVVQEIAVERVVPDLSKPGTSEDSARLDKNSSAVVHETLPGGEQQEEKGCVPDAPVHCAAPGKERVVEVAEGGSSCMEAFDGHDEAAALGNEGKGCGDVTLEARQGGVGDVHPCEGGSGVESSIDGPPSEGGQVDGGGKSSTATSSKVEGESRKSCEGAGSETEPMEVDAEEGAEAVGDGEEARSSEVMKGSPSELNESACDSLEGEEDSSRGGKSANSSCARRSLEKSFVSDGTTKALDVKEGSGSAQTLEGAKLEGGGEPLVAGSHGVRKGEEEGLGSMSEAVKEESEGGVREEEVECGAKSSGEGKKVVLGKTSEEVDGVKAKEEASGNTSKGSDGQRDSRGDHRKERGGKRNRSPSLCRNSPGGKTAVEEGGEGSEGKVSEDVCEVPAKKVKVNEESKGGGEEGQQKEEVTVGMTRGEGSDMGGDGMGQEDEPELVEAAIDEKGRRSSAKGSKEEEDEEMKELRQGERSVQEKSKRSSLNKSSSDCEIVEIEDESSTQNPILPMNKRPSDRVQTPLLFDRSKNSVKKGTHSSAVHDSHDDIVEMIIEEEEVREVSSDGGAIVGRQRGSRNMMREGMHGHKNNSTDG